MKTLGFDRIINILMFLTLNEHAETTQHLSKKIRNALFSFEDSGLFTFLHLDTEYAERRLSSGDHVDNIPIKNLKFCAKVT